MRVLVTGGSGFVGSHLIERLIARSDRVRAPVRSPRGRDYVSSLDAEPINGDLDDGTSLAAACEECEVVYHCAARVDFEGSEAEFQRTTVEARGGLSWPHGRSASDGFCKVSSCGVYHPDLLLKGAVSESTISARHRPIGLLRPLKYRAEEIVRDECGKWSGSLFVWAISTARETAS